MNKPVLQVKISGDQNSGKSSILSGFLEKMEASGYQCTRPASSYDTEDSFQAENDFHIVQFRTKQTKL